MRSTQINRRANPVLREIRAIETGEEGNFLRHPQHVD
jgi:hypothetical protein